MSKFVDFQSHSSTHPILPYCSDKKSFNEISQSKKQLEKKYNALCYAFAFPNGDYTKREINFLKKAGYNCSLTTNVGFNNLNSERYELKRISAGVGNSFYEAVVKSSGAWAYLNKFIGNNYSQINE